MDPNCQNQAIIRDPGSNYYLYDGLTYSVPGWIHSCLAINSLSLSTLQCLYVDSDFFRFLSYSLGISYYYWSITNSESFDIQLLVYNSLLSRFPPNTSISIIMKEMMVEQWKPVLSYQHFYKSCAPIYCSYSRTILKESAIGVIIILVSMIGGIVVSLRLITPHVVEFILRFLTKTNQNLRETEQGNHLSDKIKNSCDLILHTMNEYLEEFSIKYKYFCSSSSWLC